MNVWVTHVCDAVCMRVIPMHVCVDGYKARANTQSWWDNVTSHRGMVRGEGLPDP